MLQNRGQATEQSYPWLGGVKGYCDLNGKEMNLELTGLMSRVHQHEIDHLHGILIIHHISQLKRGLMIKKMFKDLKRSRGKSDPL